MKRIRLRLIWALAWLAVGLPAVPVWAEGAVQPLIKRLDGATRAKVLAALAGLILLGFAMVALIWFGARVTHRYRHGQSFLQPTPRPTEHAWADKPLDGDKTEDQP